jgi:hypothetical protein
VTRLAVDQRWSEAGWPLGSVVSHHLARAQTAAIGEAEEHANLQVRGDREQAPRLVRADHQRDLLRLANVVDLPGEIGPPQPSLGTGTGARS